MSASSRRSKRRAPITLSWSRPITARRSPRSTPVCAGVEGGLLRSDDGGDSYRWSIYFPLQSAKYPYIRQFVRTRSGVMFAGGFDKGLLEAYLVYSNDDGQTWSDISPHGDAVTLLAEDARGRLLLGATDGQRFTLSAISLTRRRSAAH